MAQTSSGERPDLSRYRLNPLDLAAIVAIAIATWPRLDILPRPTIEESWVSALHMAARQGMDWGSDLLFTYGPLGFLTQPKLYYLLTGIPAVLVAGIVTVSISAGAYLSARLSFSRWAAVPLAYVAACLLRYAALPELMVVAFFIGCVLVLRASPSASALRWLAIVAGVISSLTLLMKFNVGVLIFGLSLVMVIAMGHGWRPLGLMLGGTTFTLLAGWLVSGQRVTDLPGWIKGSIEVTRGYSSAMGVSDPMGVGDLQLAWLLILVNVLVAAQEVKAWSQRRRWAAVLLGAIFAFGILKYSFVRHDAHVFLFFASAFVGSLLWRMEGRKVVYQLGALVIAFLAFVSIGFPAASLINPEHSLTAVRGWAAILLPPPSPANVIETARAEMRSSLALDETTLAALEGQSVHVDPWETRVFWAHPELDWNPLPVFQSYNVYTEALDELNADALTVADGPTRILREAELSIDGRNPDFEAPHTTLAMLCNFRELSAGSRWQVLGRTSPSCQPERLLSRVEVPLGTEVLVPIAAAGELVYATIEGLASSIRQNVLSVVYRPDHYAITLDGTETYRLVPGTASGPLIMSVPSEINFSDRYAFPERTSTLLVQTPDYPVDETITVSFFAVPIEPRVDLAG